MEILTIASGETKRVVLPGKDNCRCEVSLSPDGRFLAYVDAQAPLAQVSRLGLYRFSDGQAFSVTDGLTSDWSPTWAADSTRLFYVSNRGGSMDLWQQRIAKDGTPTGDPKRLTVGVGMQRAAFSSDGRKLAYSKGRRVGNIYRVPILADRLATWNDAEQLTAEEALVEFIDISPDLTRLAVSSDRAGKPDLWLMATSGGQMQRLTNDPMPVWLPTWSSDGQQIAYYGYRSHSRDIWVLPSSGGVPRQITKSDGSDAGPDFSHDGRTIAFYSNRSGNADLWLVSLDDGSTKALTNNSGSNRFPKFSPDGKWLAFTSNRSGRAAVWKMPAGGGEPIALSRTPANYAIWSFDGRRLYFTRPRGDVDNIWLVQASGGGDRPVTDFSGKRGRLGREALSTDGRYLYFTWEEDLGDIWVTDVEWR